MSEKKKKPIIIREGDMPDDLIRQEVDLSYMFNGTKELRSVKVVRDGIEFWLAMHHATGRYFTNNPNDPKILNTVNNPARPRGNVSWRSGGGNPNGKPKGAKNRISMKQACEQLGANPAEFIVAVMMKNNGVLRKYGIKNPKEVTTAQQIKCGEISLNRLLPALKPAELGADGEAAISREVEEQETRNQIQVYLPGQGKVSLPATDEEIESIRQAGSTEGFMRQHEHETTPYDTEDEEEVYVWTQDAK